MFRELTRKKQLLPPEECIRILQSQKRGVLSVLGDGGYPYGMPMNHYYSEEDGHIYFHSGKQRGHRLDALKACDKVSFCVFDGGEPDTEDLTWSLFIRSVIVFGRIRIVEDPGKVAAVSRALSAGFTSDEAYIENEIRRSGPATILLELVPEHMTGKIVHEA